MSQAGAAESVLMVLDCFRHAELLTCGAAARNTGLARQEVEALLGLLARRRYVDKVGVGKYVLSQTLAAKRTSSHAWVCPPVVLRGVLRELESVLLRAEGGVSLIRSANGSRRKADRGLRAVDSASSRAIRIVQRFESVLSRNHGHRPSMQVERVISDSVELGLYGCQIRANVRVSGRLHAPECGETDLARLILDVMATSRIAMRDAGSLAVSADNVCIHSDTHAQRARNRYVRISVTVTGKALSADDIEKSFGLRSSMRKKGDEARGSVSWPIVGCHGGHMDVESRKGGTTFGIYLPAAL